MAMSPTRISNGPVSPTVGNKTGHVPGYVVNETGKQLRDRLFTGHLRRAIFPP